jgi:hypothetical protein
VQREGSFAEDFLDPGGERPRPIEYGLTAAGGAQAAGGKVGQKAGHDRVVLAVTRPRPDGQSASIGAKARATNTHRSE